jgi:hypothetical protein
MIMIIRNIKIGINEIYDGKICKELSLVSSMFITSDLKFPMFNVVCLNYEHLYLGLFIR